ncbi:EI24 domain-containing protein [Pseudotabrizicola sp. L79]|uniref:EI24 domain-containing protein n=1 Tax=Pseudotabrizicola sp. L79 TaxID=3118402 RepID=UPI002F922AB0
MIFADFLKAVGQLTDRRFRRVMGIGVALSLALLVGVYALFLMFIQWATPEAVQIPFVGPVEGLQTLLSWASALFMIGLSVFLMMPVASAFTGLFLDEVAQAVEDRHYPALPPAAHVPFMDNLIESVNFFAVLVAVNIGALLLYGFAGPFIPVVFWAVNGFLLGREYFTMVATRCIGRAGAKVLRRRYRGQIWLAGTLMAAPLSVPLVNLLIPVLGAATFTHLFHRLQSQR